MGKAEETRTDRDVLIQGAGIAGAIKLAGRFQPPGRFENLSHRQPNSPAPSQRRA
jgi:hypothetical protein